MRRRLGRGFIVFAALAIGLAACSARVPAPVVYKGMFPKTAPSTAVGGASIAASRTLIAAPRAPIAAVPAAGASRITVVELRPPAAAAPRSRKLTLRTLIQRNRLEALLRFREPPRRRQRGVHTVAAGETAYSISRRYGVDVDRLARVNDLDASYRIRPGQGLKLPDVQPPDVRAPDARLKTIVIASRPDRASDEEERREPRRGHDQALPARTGGFGWPLRGEILMGYGPQPGGRHNDGINIGAPLGTPIVASEAGIVAYVGDDVDTLGNLILIRHAGGWVTAYAHNDSVVVRRGMRVARGDVIGLTGTTGNVERPQLHFEIRKETEAVDPIELLGNRRAARRP